MNVAVDGYCQTAIRIDSSRLELFYQAEFAKPLNVIHEDQLFSNGTRTKTPEGYEWVLEGHGKALARNGLLHILNDPTRKNKKERNHVVLWNTRILPDDFLMEFTFMPVSPDSGLAILFFSAIGKDGTDIFDRRREKRGGVFRAYHSGELDCYHISYWAIPRQIVNLRKNHGFRLVAATESNPWQGKSPPYRVRLLKISGRIELETNGEIVLTWEDDGTPLGAGCFGLRTMDYTKEMRYSDIKIWRVKG